MLHVRAIARDCCQCCVGARNQGRDLRGSDRIVGDKRCDDHRRQLRQIWLCCHRLHPHGGRGLACMIFMVVAFIGRGRTVLHVMTPGPQHIAFVQMQFRPPTTSLPLPRLQPHSDTAGGTPQLPCPLPRGVIAPEWGKLVNSRRCSPMGTTSDIQTVQPNRPATSPKKFRHHRIITEQEPRDHDRRPTFQHCHLQHLRASLDMKPAGRRGTA
jgi:hypothetical protein